MTPGGALSRRERLALAAGEPFLPSETRDLLVRDLMQARRADLTARRSGSLDDLSAAHARIDAAKRALGERGPVWRNDGAADYNRYPVRNTPSPLKRCGRI